MIQPDTEKPKLFGSPLPLTEAHQNRSILIKSNRMQQASESIPLKNVAALRHIPMKSTTKNTELEATLQHTLRQNESSTESSSEFMNRTGV